MQIKERDFVLEDMLDQQFLYNDNSRYVVLLRDPLAAKSSALARFQANPTRAALELEANMSVTAHQLLAELVAQLPCERTLFLGYEALIALPQLHVGVLAAFLGVSPKDDRLSEWLGSLTPCPTCAHMATAVAGERDSTGRGCALREYPRGEPRLRRAPPHRGRAAAAAAAMRQQVGVRGAGLRLFRGRLRAALEILRRDGRRPAPRPVRGPLL